MKYLLYISIVWAIALTAPNLIITNRQLNIAKEQQELTKKALELKKMEIEVLQRFLPDQTPSKKSSKMDVIL